MRGSLRLTFETVAFEWHTLIELDDRAHEFEAGTLEHRAAERRGPRRKPADAARACGGERVREQAAAEAAAREVGAHVQRVHLAAFTDAAKGDRGAIAL